LNHIIPHEMHAHNSKAEPILGSVK
jgi:hypothetical protein